MQMDPYVEYIYIYLGLRALGGFQLSELEMAVIFVSTGVSTGLMVDKMMKVAPGGLVVPLLPKQTQLQVQTPRLDVDFGVFIALRDKDKGPKKNSKIPLWI